MGEETLIGAAELRKILPHRYPFVLIDRVNSVDRNHISVIKCVTTNEPFFQGHFPELPVMPGVLIVEAMAQAAIVLAYHNKQFDPATQMVFFMGIDGARFRQPVVPGDVLQLDIEQKRGGRILRAAGTATVDGNKVAEAELLATVR